MGRRPFLLAAAAAIGYVAAPAPGLAQVGGQDRTGPEAGAPPLPPYPDRRELSPPLVPTTPADAQVAAAPAARMPIREVRVASEGDADGAMPPPAWEPPAETASGLLLQHAPGQPLDADWVRAQFAFNIVEGDTAAKAIGLVQLINRAFLTAGFFNSGLVVPEQRELAVGVLNLRLIYGRLSSAEEGAEPINVEWGGGRSAGLSGDYIRQRFGSTRRLPLSAYEIEREFRLLAEDPAIRTVSADLRPGTRPGEASLNLIIYPEERFDFYTGAANDRSPSVGGERLFSGGFARSLLAGGDLLSGEFGITDGLKDGQIAYSIPVFSPRTSLNLRGSFNNAAVIDRPLLPLDISARDRSVQAGITHRFLEQPLMPTEVEDRWKPSQTLVAGAQVVHRWQRSFLFGEPFSFAPGSVDGRTVYTALRLTGDYLMRNVDQVLAVSLTGTLGLGGTQSDIPTIPNPDDNFKSLLLQVNYAKLLGDSGFELRARLTGQLADGVLYSGERFSIGGETSVRGYRENLFLVDNAIVGSLELAYSFSLTSGAERTGEVDWGAFTASTFVDAAHFDSFETDLFDDILASVGVALAWNPSDAIQARISYAQALNEVDISGTRDLQDRGFQFRIVVHPFRWF
jgi:hemolysin activation/secretion protein